jgi:hypothetical protein
MKNFAGRLHLLLYVCLERGFEMRKIILTVAVLASLMSAFCYADDARQIYQSMKVLEGDWVLSPAAEQEGKATRHALVSPLIGTDEIGISFKLIGRGSTLDHK